MKIIWCALVFAASLGTSADIGAGGRGHDHGRHAGGRGYYGGHRALGYGHYRGHRVWNRGRYYGYPRRNRFGIGFYFGSPFRYRYYPYYGYRYYPYYGYPPAVVTVPSQPPVYIEKEPERSFSESPGGYWYYCTNPPGYYPYVGECSEEWHPVPARPPAKR